jgi:SH3-like domain-containing protein
VTRSVMWMMTAALLWAFGAAAAEKTGAVKAPAPTPQQAPKSTPAQPSAGAEKANPKTPKIEGPKVDDGAKAASDEADDGKTDAKAAIAGLPLPRFVSLRTNPINLRTGPGVRYPVEWVYVRRHLPVEVIGEFDTWRQIRDIDGAEGWVHQTMLSGKRTAIVAGEARKLMRSGEESSENIATLERGVLVNIQRCPPDTESCRVEIDGMQGWLKREYLWGLYPDETVQ